MPQSGLYSCVLGHDLMQSRSRGAKVVVSGVCVAGCCGVNCCSCVGFTSWFWLNVSNVYTDTDRDEYLQW